MQALLFVFSLGPRTDADVLAWRPQSILAQARLLCARGLALRQCPRPGSRPPHMGCAASAGRSSLSKAWAASGRSQTSAELRSAVDWDLPCSGLPTTGLRLAADSHLSHASSGVSFVTHAPHSDTHRSADLGENPTCRGTTSTCKRNLDRQASDVSMASLSGSVACCLLAALPLSCRHEPSIAMCLAMLLVRCWLAAGPLPVCYCPRGGRRFGLRNASDEFALEPAVCDC